LALAAVALVVSVVQGWRAVGALRDAEELSQGLSDRIVAGDVAGARTQLTAFDRATTRARESTDSPMWWLGSKVPYFGRNIGALRTVSAASDSVADEALPGLVDLADQVRLEAFRPKNGRVDIRAVVRALPVLARADRALSRADARIAAIDPDSLLPLLRQSMAVVKAKSHQAATAAAAAHDAARLMPTMLGADGPTRRYLMLVMNNAEVRSLGGMPGSMAVITARRGKVKMGEQGGILDVPPLEKNALPIKPELAGGFDSTIATDIRDTTSVPDFPRAAQAAAAIVANRWDEHFDGVVAIDPVALGYVLEGLGTVDVGDNLKLNQYNAAGALLNGVYIRYPDNPERQDDVFEFAARRSFDALVGGGGDSIRTIRGLVRGVQERRVMLWSRADSEQQRIRRTGISGSLSHDRRTPEVAFFVNDGASSKMEFYLRVSSTLQTLKCYADGVQTLRLTTTLSSEAPQSVRLPASVTGPGNWVTPGDMRLHAMIVAPQGGQITAMKVDGRRAPVGSTAYRGRQIARVPRVLPPGVSTVLSVDLTTGPNSTGAPVLRTTPGTVANDDAVNTRVCR
jgi:hypothetical protein